MRAAGFDRKRLSGIGVGFRAELAANLFNDDGVADPALGAIRFVEVHPENYVRRGGQYAAYLERVKQRWPILTHGLTLGFGNAGPHDHAHLGELRAFLSRVETPWHSDHLCFAHSDGAFLHDLLPIPFTTANAKHCATRLRETADALERPVAFENVSQYIAPTASEMTELEFILEVLDRSDAPMLLDVNNVYVNAKNHGFDARAFLDRIPPSRVAQLHVAGHMIRPDGLRIDTHGEAICDDVYALLEHTLTRIGHVPVLLERDQNFPSFDALSAEITRLDAIYQRATASVAESTSSSSASSSASVR